MSDFSINTGVVLGLGNGVIKEAMECIFLHWWIQY
jgi:hypothetical protein